MTCGFEEHCAYEANAYHDYVSEAYAATLLDPYEEGYCSYVFDCQDAGEPVLDFCEWKAGIKASYSSRIPLSWTDGASDCPF